MAVNSLTTEARRPGQNIVRAWFDTVLNPLLSGLSTEASLVAEGNLTWKSQSERFASLVPVKEFLLADAWDNLEQFLDFYPEFNALIEQHDRTLEELGARCRDFECVYVHQITAGKKLADFPIEAEDPARIVAEYVINEVRKLPRYYSTAEFWNARSREFFEMRENDESRTVWEEVQAAAVRFEKAVTQLEQALRGLRRELSISMDVPIVSGSR
jgi:hypothetical protein